MAGRASAAETRMALAKPGTMAIRAVPSKADRAANSQR
jgi:hypothetical protein